MRRDDQAALDAIQSLRKEFNAPVIRAVVNIYTAEHGQPDTSRICDDALLHGIDLLNIEIVRLMCLSYLAGRNSDDAA
jgi:hypothetical protein